MHRIKGKKVMTSKKKSANFGGKWVGPPAPKFPRLQACSSNLTGEGIITPLQSQGSSNLTGEGILTPLQYHGSSNLTGEGIISPLQSHGSSNLTGEGIITTLQCHGSSNLRWDLAYDKERDETWPMSKREMRLGLG